MTKNEFIQTIAPLVIKKKKKRGNPLFSSVVIAQAICESAWGQSKIMMKANAIFGIKATSNWKGKVYNAKTQECYDGSTYTNITACFRAYNSLSESISDYFDLITKSERYRKACVSDNPLECITAIKNGGYATSPTYINTIMSIINSNNLRKYDNVEDVENSVDNSKSIEELAKEVIAGKYGNGEERKQKLGKLYNEVQAKVNSIYGQSVSHKKPNIEEIAKAVIRGEYGNGQERKNKLGNLYNEVQKRVNEILKGK